jgi:hypothetical protein
MNWFDEDHILCWSVSLSKNKAFEAQIGYFCHWSWFEFWLKWTRHQDHAGIDLHLEICGFHLCLNFYDKRHWGLDNWEKYDKESRK